jgi:hypothetical protein
MFTVSDSYLYLLRLPERLEGIQLWGLQWGTAVAALAGGPAANQGTLGYTAQFQNACCTQCSFLCAACLIIALMRARLVSEKVIQLQGSLAVRQVVHVA